MHVVLAAAEPEVTDPVAIDFGPDGRLWVVEMNDYGRGVYETFPQGGRIRWLRDANNDGYFEEAATFVDGLRFPTSPHQPVFRVGVLLRVSLEPCTNALDGKQEYIPGCRSAAMIEDDHRHPGSTL